MRIQIRLQRERSARRPGAAANRTLLLEEALPITRLVLEAYVLQQGWHQSLGANGIGVNEANRIRFGSGWHRWEHAIPRLAYIDSGTHTER